MFPSFPCNLEALAQLPRPPRREGAFAYLIREQTAKLARDKQLAGNAKAAGRPEQKPASVTKSARPAERAAAPAPYDFSHLSRAAVKRDRYAKLTHHDTEPSEHTQQRCSLEDMRAEKFAAEMEQVMAQVEGRAARPLLGGPTQDHLDQPMSGDQIVDVIRRRDAARAARRSDRVG